MAAMPEVRHPLFARLYSRMSARAERRGQADHRRELLVGLSGRVVEVGAGHGLNFKRYPETVTEVVAIEPEAYLRELAEQAAREAIVSVRVVDGVAGRLPVADEEFDAGVASLMLCTVPDQVASLAEFHHVIRPGGELRFYEHVLAERPGLAWELVAGGCNPDRDTGPPSRSRDSPSSGCGASTSCPRRSSSLRNRVSSGLRGERDGGGPCRWIWG